MPMDGWQERQRMVCVNVLLGVFFTILNMYIMHDGHSEIERTNLNCLTHSMECWYPLGCGAISTMRFQILAQLSRL